MKGKLLIGCVSAVVAACLFQPDLSAQEQVRDTISSADHFIAKLDSLHSNAGTTENHVQQTPSNTVPGAASTAEDTVRTLSPALLAATADSLRLNYGFKEALKTWNAALKQETDSLKKTEYRERMMLAANAVSMMGYCSSPSVVASRTFSVKDFYLYYPLADNSWRKTPNILDIRGGGAPSSAIYVPESAKRIYYSATDEDGIKNIYTTSDAGGVWSVPRLLNEHITSDSDEIFPMVSKDGKTLWFASRGLYGIGGYDLYVSKWNDETGDWGIPENMGFPYSSPYDDYLFLNTEDGQYSLFASNRDCGKDSVCVYVLQYDPLPVRSSMDEGAIRQLSHLAPTADPSKIGSVNTMGESEPESQDTRKYMQKMAEVRKMRNLLAGYTEKVDRERAGLVELEGAARDSLAAVILAKELELSAMNDSLTRAVAAMRKIEMDFLMNGVVLDPDKLQAAASREIVGVEAGYVFTRNTLGSALAMEILKPEPVFDYTLSVLPEGRFAENNNLPGGLVYQIQIFTSTAKPRVADLKGLSPVFERRSGTRYVCYAGLFGSYQDALANLNKVKKAGFKDAIIKAFSDGREIPVLQARGMEDTKTEKFTVRFRLADGQGLSDAIRKTVREHTDKDLARLMENGEVFYLAGPLNLRTEAESLAADLLSAGAAFASVETE